MRAAVYTRYGPPDVIQINELATPIPKDNEVLIKVRAAGLNPLDGGMVSGGGRIVTGLRKPRFTRLGVDVAGLVEALGRNVTRFKPGDEVFGACIRDPQASGFKVCISQGAFADYACVPESLLVLKPVNVTFQQAASVPVAAFTALQGLRDKGHIQPGHKVLINGASGGVGTFAVQIAKWFAAQVTSVCSTRNVDMVGSIGADHVIDYTQENFTQSGQRYDLFLDCIGNHSLSASRRVLNPKGIHIMVGDKSGRAMIGMLFRLIAALGLSWFVSRKHVTFLAKPRKEDLAMMHDLMKAGDVRPVIDRCYSLGELPEAIRYLEEGHAQGKVVITLGAD